MVKHLPLLCLLGVFLSPKATAQCPTTGNTVTVTNINASGAGSLANAITCVNNNAPLLNIVFNISGAGTKIIRPTATLPSITKAGASIDGNTQGSTVILDGSLLTATGNGLVLAANNISIEGLYIRNFSTPSGIAISVVSGNGALISGNTIAGNRTGISTGTPVQSFLITDNTFGLDPAGATVGNTSNAINIGGLPTGGVITGNTIANSSASGINVIGGTVLISNNSIYCNTTEGITRGGTPPAVPVITRANTQQIRGTAASGRTIEVFAHSSAGCSSAPCQGKTLLGTVTTPATGIWTLDLSPGQVSAGTQVTATSTQNSNNTSKFSTCATVANCATLNATASGVDVRCFGAGNGSATAAATGGNPTAGYTFVWNTGATGASIANLAPGTYTVTVSDASGCSDTATATVGQPAALTLTITTQDIACAGGNNGAATANPAGGTPGYSYRWNTGQTAQTIAGLAAGNYSVTVFDQNGCQDSETVTLNAPPALQVTITPQQIACAGNNTGAATANPGGGTPGYIYLWNTGQTTQTIAGLGPGTYTVTVTDFNNCSSIRSTALSAPPPLTVSITSQAIACAGINNGAATANPGGGTPGYTYRWNTGQTTQTIAGLGPGTYTVTTTDQNNCETSESVALNAPPVLSVSIAPQNISCFGGSNGVLTANPTGGTPGYTYRWNTGQTTQSISGLSAGAYTVTITDVANCSASQSANLTAPPALNLSLAPQAVLCFGENTGGVNAVANGGTPAYTYLWSNGQTTANLNTVAAGTYTLTLRDANGCTLARSETVTQPGAALSVSLNSTPETAQSANNGTAGAVPGGGTPAYQYLWSNGSTAANLSNLPPGVYTVTVRDANNCTVSRSVSVAAFACSGLTLSVQAQAARCRGSNDGSATAMPGGSSGYGYQWSNGATTAAIANLMPGAYTVTVTDAAGCTVSGSANVSEPTALSLSVVKTDESAANQRDGTAAASAGGGTPNYQYLWSNGATTATIANLAPNTYTVTVRDANNCTDTRSVTIVAFTCPGLTLNMQAQAARCQGGSDGSANAVPGGSSGYRYLWSNGATTEAIANLTPGTYTVSVTDVTGCTVSASVLVGEPPALNLSIVKTDESAANQRDGTASANGVGGTPAYQYLWSTGATTAAIANLEPGTYTATIRDANGCTRSAVVNILPGSGGGCITRPVYAVLTPSKVCGNEPFILEIDELYPTTGLRYHVFLPNGDSINTSQTSVSIRPTSTAYSGEYFVVRDSAGCRSKAVGGAPVEVISLPADAFFAGRDTVLCNNNAVALRARVPAGNTGSWTALGSARIDQPAAANTTARDLTPGDNAFVWKIALPGCPNAALDTVHYFYETEPIVADDKYTLSRAADIAVLEVLLNDRLVGVPDTLVSTVSGPAVGQLEYLSAGKRFRYTVEDDFRGTVHFQYAVCSESVSACGFGCDTATVTIEVLNLPKVPEGLIPEDPGPNGSLTIKGVGSFERVEILIFNRWGDLVYQSKQYDNNTPWQGTFKGKKLPQGAYYYQLQAYDRGNQKAGEMQTGVLYLFERG